MPSYNLELPDIGLVKVTKNKGQRSLRIRLSAKGEVLVSVPWLTPQIAVAQFVNSRKEWIIKNRPVYDHYFEDGQKFGENLILRIHTGSSKNRSKSVGNTLNVYLNEPFDPNNAMQHDFIEKKVLTAMKNEAETVLLPQLFEIARLSGHQFNQAYVKNLKSRWGSCDSQKNIILNIYMTQISEELREYVILHELTHTVHMNHSPKFWAHLEQYLPNYKELRRDLKKHQPRIEMRL